MKRKLEIIESGRVVNEAGVEVDLTNRDSKFDQVLELKRQNKMLKNVVIYMSFIIVLMVGTVIFSIKGAGLSEEVANLANKKVDILEKQIKEYDSLVANLEQENKILKQDKKALLDTKLYKPCDIDVIYNTIKGDRVKTYIKYSDTIISTGSIVRHYDIHGEIVTVYTKTPKALDKVNKKLGYEYYSGIENYIGAISQVKGVYLIKH